MSCPHYYWDHGYACRKTGKNVNDDTYNKYCRYGIYDYSDCPIYKAESSSSSGCFLTSACVEAKGLPDDCRELTILRRYRDEYLAKQDCGQCEINRYYHIAPQIVEKIKALPDAPTMFEQIYNELVLPCVHLIDAGSMEEAHTLYRDYTLLLEKKYLDA